MAVLCRGGRGAAGQRTCYAGAGWIVTWSVDVRDGQRQRLAGLPWGRGVLLVVGATAPWYILAELHTPGFWEYFLVGEHWHRFLTPGWSGDLYGSAHAYPYGSVWLFACMATFPWSFLFAVLRPRRWCKGRPAPAADPTDRPWQLYLLCWGLSACLFFTAAGNILWSYVLPGLPALALWAAGDLCSTMARPICWRFRLAAILTVVPSLFLLFVLHQNVMDQGQHRSAKALIELYQSVGGARAPLVFLGKRPYSAMFYSQGRAELASDLGAFSRRLHDEMVFVALPDEMVSRLPVSLKRQLTPLAQVGVYWLYIGGEPTSAEPVLSPATTTSRH